MNNKKSKKLIEQWFIKIFFKDGTHHYERYNETKKEIQKHYSNWMTVEKIEFLEFFGMKEKYGIAL